MEGLNTSPERKKRRHISETSPEYVRHREAQKNVRVDEAFGKRELGLIDFTERLRSTDNGPSKVQASAENDLQMRAKNLLLDQSRREMRGLLRHEATTDAACSFFLEMLDPSVPEHIREPVEAVFRDFAAPMADGFSGLLETAFSNEVWEQMLRLHIALFEAEKARFEAELPLIQARFRDRVLQEIASGYLPMTEEFLERRMQETRVQFTDSISVRTAETYGDYLPEEALIRLSTRLRLEEFEHVVTHEYVHAVVSGRTILHGPSRLPTLDNGIRHQRIGLAFDVLPDISDQGKAEWSQRFRWLNESRTEKITMRLLGMNKSGTYQKEREADDLICQLTSETLLNKAYCENFDPDSPQGERVPAWRELIHSLDTVTGAKQGKLLQELRTLEESIEASETE